MGSGAELNPKVLWKHCLIQLFNYLTLFTQLTLFLVWFFPGRSPIFATGTLRLIRGKEKMPERALPGWELLAGWSNSNFNFLSNWMQNIEEQARYTLCWISNERGAMREWEGEGEWQNIPTSCRQRTKLRQIEPLPEKNWAGSHRTWQKILSCWKKWPFPIQNIYVDFCPRFGPWGY